MTNDAQYLTAIECARRAGVTVRALRVYEAKGLLAPARTAKNWRVYGPRDIARLGEILMLKSAGLSLEQIGDLLSGRDTDPDRLLALQQERLTRRRGEIERHLGLVGGLRARIAGGHVPSLEELLDMVKEMQMSMDQTDSVAWKRYEQTRPRVAIDLPVDSLGEYTGYFRFQDGGMLEITTEQSRLFLRVMEQPRVEMFAEAADQFFLKAVSAQVSFDRAGSVVTGLTLHQGGVEMPAARSDATQFAAAEAALQARSVRNTAFPGSAELLRRLIDEQRAGQPDYDRMAEPLAVLVREQLPVMQEELARLGDLREMAFQGVSADGFDLYNLCFAQGAVECGVSLGGDGLVNGFYMRAATWREKD